MGEPGFALSYLLLSPEIQKSPLKKSRKNKKGPKTQIFLARISMYLKTPFKYRAVRTSRLAAQNLREERVMEEIEELREYCKKIDKLVKEKGPKREYCEARYKAAQIYLENGYKDFGFRQTLLAKNELYQIVKFSTRSISPDRKGFDLFELDDYCREHEVETAENKLFWDLLFLESKDLFDSYMLYLERKRQPQARFYYPRRECLRKTGVVQGLQDLEDDVLDILSISLPPGTGKTTLEKFFCSWVMGKHPDDYNLFYSHSSEITRMYYDGVDDIIENDSEYCFNEIFPTVYVQNKNAKAETLNLNAYKPFASLQCTSVGAKNSGKVRANRYLFCDDLIGGIEEALNKSLLDKLWRVYSVDARQRKLNGRVKEIHIATRWSVHDVIGRLQLMYKGNDRARFIAVPDIDPETGKSNFNYKYNGMDEAFFEEQAKIMDDITYRCLYKNDPIEREGILYHADELRRYLSLPLKDPDGIYAIADTKNSGTDFMVLLVLYRYENDFYCVDCVCDDNVNFDVQTQKCANLLFRHKVQQAEFESNNGGERVAADVDKALKAMGGFTNITTKPTETNKETRIIVNADWVKKNILFKDETMYGLKEDYGTMVTWLCRYSIVGKNVHDDVPDCFANAALYFTRGQTKGTVEATFNPFRSKFY